MFEGTKFPDFKFFYECTLFTRFNCTLLNPLFTAATDMVKIVRGRANDHNAENSCSRRGQNGYKLMSDMSVLSRLDCIVPSKIPDMVKITCGEANDRKFEISSA